MNKRIYQSGYFFTPSVKRFTCSKIRYFNADFFLTQSFLHLQFIAEINH